MFTGLIQATGTIVSLVPSRNPTAPPASPSPPPPHRPPAHGDSIAVTGVCLTALDITANPPTSPPTSPPRPSPAPPSPASSPAPSSTSSSPPPPAPPSAATSFRVTSMASPPFSPSTPSIHRRPTVRLAPPPRHPAHLTRYVVPQGSITVEGISLTVASILGDAVEIAIIPHTYAATASTPSPPAPPQHRGRRPRQLRRAPVPNRRTRTWHSPKPTSSPTATEPSPKDRITFSPRCFSNPS